MVFLALLAIAIGVLLVLSLVLVGLVEAPWPVLLVGLLAALYGLQRELIESQAFEPLTDLDSPQKPPKVVQAASAPPQDHADGEDPTHDEMLTYRGIRYRVSAHQDHDNLEGKTLVEGVYRGQHWQRWRSNSENSSHSADTSEITYRGHKVIKPEHEANRDPEA